MSNRLPHGWTTDRLKDVVPAITGGATPESGRPEYWEGGEIVWVTPTDFSATTTVEIATSARRITLAGLHSCATQLLPRGTVVMSSRASIGDAKIATIELCTNQGFIAFRCDERRLHNRYLRYQIESNTGPYFAEIAPGTTFKEISRGVARREPVILPPISEQRRIADFLDRACKAVDEAIAKKHEQISTLDGVKRDAIQVAVTRGVTKKPPVLRATDNTWIAEVPEKWLLVSLKRVADIHSGLTLGKEYDGPLVERPYLRVANVQDGHLDLTEVTTIEVPPAVAHRLTLRVGDVLMTEGGDLDKLGRGTLWNGEVPDCLHQNHIFAVRCFAHKLVPAFLAYLTASQYGRDYFEATGKKTTNLAATNSTKVGQFPIPLPPLAEQRAICAHLDATLGHLRQVAECIQGQIDVLTDYRKSLIQEYVTGQRRVPVEQAEKAIAYG